MAKRGKLKAETGKKPAQFKFPITGYIILMIGIIWIIASLTEWILHWIVGLVIVLVGAWILVKHYYKR